MKLLNVVVGAVVAAATVVAVNTAPVGATAAKECKFEYANFGGNYGLGQGFEKHPDVVSIQFRIVGDEDCRMDVTLTTWKIPHATLQPYPVEEQTYFAHQTGKQLKPGFHTLAAKVPDCFWQADLVKGVNPTGPGGKLPYEENRMLNATLGGNKKCEKPKTPPTTPQPPTGGGGAVESAQTPGKLVETGPASVIGAAFGVSTVTGVAHNVVSRRRKS